MLCAGCVVESRVLVRQPLLDHSGHASPVRCVPTCQVSARRHEARAHHHRCTAAPHTYTCLLVYGRIVLSVEDIEALRLLTDDESMMSDDSLLVSITLLS